MEVLADRSFRPQPLRLGHPRRNAKLDLNQLGRPFHLFDSISFVFGRAP
jgi:hypothetical protein